MGGYGTHTQVRSGVQGGAQRRGLGVKGWRAAGRTPLREREGPARRGAAGEPLRCMQCTAAGAASPHRAGTSRGRAAAGRGQACAGGGVRLAQARQGWRLQRAQQARRGGRGATGRCNREGWQGGNRNYKNQKRRSGGRFSARGAARALLRAAPPRALSNCTDFRQTAAAATAWLLQLAAGPARRAAARRAAAAAGRLARARSRQGAARARSGRTGTPPGSRHEGHQNVL
jgi:hypothetical protein